MNEQKNVPKRRVLGRGLDAILPEVLGDGPAAPHGATSVAVTLLARSPYQARQRFSEESLEELARSIKEHGVVQPIVVRPQAGGRYEIIAGERRWRAAQRAGLSEVPVIVRQATEKQAMEIHLVENLHRDDLNAIEKAEGLGRLAADHGYTHEKLAERIAKSRAAVTNLMRLLDLPLPVQEMIRGEKLSEGHGRALLRIESDRLRIEAAMAIAGKGLSVREAEALAARMAERPAAGHVPAGKPRLSPEARELCESFQRRLGCRVNLRHSRSGKGKLEIYYRNLDELDRIKGIILKR